MKKSFRHLILALTAGLLLLSHSGCSSLEQNRAEAVDRARKYLLENAHDLSPEETAKIQFTDPVLLTGDIFSHGVGIALDLNQVCIAWPTERENEFYLVYGASTDRMSDWRPIQFFRKNFSKMSEPLVDATEKARTYMFDSLYRDLSTLEINHVRFMFPAVLETDFSLMIDPDSDLDEEERSETKKALLRQKQFSLVWATPGKEPLVFCGTAREDLEGWKLNFAGTMPEELLKKHTLKIVKKADQEDSALVSAETTRMLDQRDQQKEEERKALEQKKLEESVQKHFESTKSPKKP